MSICSVPTLRPTITGQALYESALILILLCISAIAISLRPIGFMGGGWDDIQYFLAAAKWIETPPYIGETHWELRHPFVLQLSAMMGIGRNFAGQLLVIPVIWYYISLATAYLTIRLATNYLTAFFVCIIFATTPVVAGSATELMPDIMEFAFVIAAISIFLTASHRQVSRVTLLTCGVLVGLAWLTRQTSGALILLLVASFFYKPAFGRKHYLIIGIAAFSVLAIETVWLWISTGDPLYRLHTDMRHVLIPSAHMVGGVGNVDQTPLLNTHNLSHWVPSSPLTTNWFLDPYVAFFTTRNYGLLFFAAIPAAIYFLRNRPIGRLSTTLFVCIFLGVLWFLFATYILAIRPQARYFIPLIFSVSVLVGVYITNLWVQRKRTEALVATSILIVSNLLLCDLQQYRNYSADAVISYSNKSNSPIHISRAVDASTNFEILLANPERSITTLPPEIGDIILIGPRDKNTGIKFTLCDDESLVTYTPRPFIVGHTIQLLGADKIIPERLFKRMLHPDGVVKIGRRCA